MAAPLLSALVLAVVSLLPGGPQSAVRTDEPLALTSQVTDRAGVLGDTATVETDLRELRSETGLQLFVAYVDSFDGLSGDDWAARTYETSGMGGKDVLVAVAVEDRRYGTHATTESGITADEDAQVRSGFIEPRLAQQDWEGAVTAASQGYARAASGSRSGGAGGLGLGLGLLVTPL